jgi:hypothetical protein
MIDTTIPIAPAGLPGAPGAGARAAVHLGVPATSAPSVGVPSWAGSAVPAGGGAPAQGSGAPSAATLRLRRTAPDGALASIAGADAAAGPLMHEFQLLFTNDGTTPLGIHPPGGPTS